MTAPRTWPPHQWDLTKRLAQHIELNHIDRLTEAFSNAVLSRELCRRVNGCDNCRCNVVAGYVEEINNVLRDAGLIG